MEYHSDEREQGAHSGYGAMGFLAGALLGGLVSAGTMLLLAPQSGKKTRAKLQHATVELRDQTVAGIEDVVAQTRAKAGQITAGVREKAGDLQQRGQDLLDEQKERWSPVVEAGKKAAKGSGG
jgi:gas vesicle protein